jgi:beta-galactosidase
MVEYWHWHSIHNAIESYWKGVLSHDLVENETYRDCCVIGQEWKRIGSSLKNLKKVNRVALLADNDSLTALSLFPTETNGKSSYNCILRSLADALFHLNIEYDIIPADASLLDEYDCILIPALYSAKESFLVALDRYVADGGNLVMTFKSAFSDEHMKIYHDTQPHVLSKTFGIAYDRFTYPKNVTVSYQGTTSDASEWMELVTCCGARSLADYHHPAWGRYSAVAENSYGKGHTLYLATLLNDAIVQRLLSDFFQEIGLQEPEKLPHNAQYPVSVKQGKNDAGEHIMYYLNYSADIHMAENIAGDGIELITGAPVAKGESFRLEPWGVAVLQIPQF